MTRLKINFVVFSPEQMIVESVHTLVEHTRPQPENTRRMSLVDLGKRLLEAAKRGETDAVRALMSNGAPFTTDWVSLFFIYITYYLCFLQR